MVFSFQSTSESIMFLLQDWFNGSAATVEMVAYTLTFCKLKWSKIEGSCNKESAKSVKRENYWFINVLTRVLLRDFLA